jgi:hypothetical protein
MLGLGAASTALDALSLLKDIASPSKSKTGISTNRSADFRLDSATSVKTGLSNATAADTGGTGKLSTSTLLSAQAQAEAAQRPDFHGAVKSLFTKLDGDADGKVTQSEFETALGQDGNNVAAAASVFGKVDANGDGSITADELSDALKSIGRRRSAGPAIRFARRAVSIRCRPCQAIL